MTPSRQATILRLPTLNEHFTDCSRYHTTDLEDSGDKARIVPGRYERQMAELVRQIRHDRLAS